jgi:hypothetical protein
VVLLLEALDEPGRLLPEAANDIACAKIALVASLVPTMFSGTSFLLACFVLVLSTVLFFASV